VHTSVIIVDSAMDERTGNGTRRYGDTIVDGVSDPGRPRPRTTALQPPVERTDHPASHATGTEALQAWRRKRARRCVLK